MSRLSDRARELDATAAEIAELAGVDADTAADWLDGKADPDDAEALIRLRAFLAPDPAAARAALDRLRRRYSRSLRGDGATQAKVTVPYGTNDPSTTGEAPK